MTKGWGRERKPINREVYILKWGIQVYIYSEKTKKKYDSVEDCLQAEKEYEEKLLKEKEEKEKLTAERKTRAKEVEDAFKTAYGLLDDFVKDYGNFHFTLNKNFPYKIYDLFF